MKEVDGKVQVNVEITRMLVEGSTAPGDGQSDGATSISSGGAQDMSEFVPKLPLHILVCSPAWRRGTGRGAWRGKKGTRVCLGSDLGIRRSRCK
jgi:hypothetical protein